MGLVNKGDIGLPGGVSDEFWGDGGKAPILFARGGLRVRQLDGSEAKAICWGDVGWEWTNWKIKLPNIYLYT